MIADRVWTELYDVRLSKDKTKKLTGLIIMQPAVAALKQPLCQRDSKKTVLT